MKKHIVIALAVISIILGFVISCEEPQVNLPTQYTTPTIKGTLSIPTSQNVSASEVFVKVIDSDGNTVTVQKANADGSFVVQNLNAGKKYSVLFTSVEPEFTNRAVGGSSGVGGWLYDVVPAVQEGNNVGNVKLKPLGTIKGKALIDGESEHYDITVYIPGTSYIAKTDKDGSFSIYNVPEGKYTLRYTLDDHLPVMVKDVMLVCPEDVEKPEVKVKKVTLKSSLGSVEGRAILGDSNDSTGVKVNLESEDKSLTYPAFTSKDGYYTISGIQPGTYRVIVSYEGYTSQMSSYFSVTSGTLTKIDTLIELYSTSGFLKGSVSLNDSDTKSDIAVTIRNMEDGNTFTVMTDVNGDFSKRLKPGTYTVDSSHSGYSSYSVEATVVENNTTTLSPVILYSVYGTITGSSFSPEEAVTLIDKNGNPIQTLQSSNDCTYKFSGIQSGTYRVRFSKTGFSSNTISDVVVTPSKTTTINGVELKSLYGTLKGVAGSEGDSVSLMKGGVVVETVTVDSSRQYLFTGIEPGNYSVRFSREGYAPYESETVAVAAASETTIDGKVLISIYGTISGKSGSEGETVSLIKDGTVLKTVVTSSDRSYSFTSVDPGTYKVRFSKDGYTSYESDAFVLNAGNELALDGKELISLYGSIYGKSNSEGETISLIKGESVLSTVVISSDRSYSFSDITPGEYKVTFSKDDYKSSPATVVSVEAGKSVEVNGPVLISMYGSVEGKSHSGEEMVTLIDEKGSQYLSVVSNSDGSYSFPKVLVGTYSVKFSKNGFASHIVSDVVVAPSEKTTINGTALKSSYGTVKGVAGSEGDGVSLMKDGVVVETVTVDSSRQYLFTGIEPGNYSVRFSREGYTPYESETVAVAAASETTINGKVLISIYGTIVGTSYSENETVSLIKDGTVLKTVVTTEDRSYSFTPVAPGTYKVRFSKDGYTSYESDAFVLNAGNELTVDGKELISLYGSIYGKSNSEGETISLIKGESVVSTVVTSSDKNYAFSNIMSGEYKVTFSKDDYKSSPATVVSVEAGKSVEVNGPVLISMYGSVEGKSHSGEEMVTLIDEKGSQYLSIVSNTDGSYSFPKVLVGTYSVKFSKSGFASHIVSDVVVAPSEKTTINGTALKSSYGTVKGVAGSEGDSVSLMKDGVVVETVTVDSSRQYSFTGIEPASYSVRFSREGYTPYESDSFVLNAGSELTVDGRVLVSIYGSITGTSYSEGETVSLIKDGTVLKTVVTSSDRSYSFTTVDPGTYKVRFSKEGYTPYDSEGVTVSAGMEAIVNGNSLVSKYGTIKGTSASEGETVYLVRNGVQIKSATTLESKEYVFSEIEPGEYSVRFTKNGYKTYESEAITVKTGESYVVDGQKLVSSYGAVAGFVFLSGSDDYSGVTVTLTNSESITSSLVATSASDGSFRITDIKEAGTYLLTYSKNGYVTENTKSVDVTIGSVANAGSVTLKSTYATVKGTIQLEGASSYENVTILLKNENNQYTSTTNQKGGYLINRVLPGTYTLLASKDGYVTSTPVEVVIEPSSEKTIEAKTLSVAIRSVTGRVTLELLSDYSGALVTATNLSDNTLVYSAITNSSGDFTLAGMKPGEYSVVISCNGYRSVTLPTINIVSSSTTNLSATNMLINRGTVSGTVTLEGRSLSSGIKVELLRGSEVYAESTTDESGNYSFYVPQGNYSGVRYSKTDFASVSVSRNIALFADNYVSVGDTTLSATHNTISGTVDVLTTENENDVTISFDGVASIPAVTTSESGEFTFEHIPVGSYVMRFRRTDCSDITLPINVVAADVISLGTVTITPNTATIMGTVVLKEGLSSSGVTVSVDLGGGKVLSTTTDAGGRYEIGGVSIADEYTVAYSKSGWDAIIQKISPKLNLLEIREMPEITLVDTTAPVLRSVTINNGGNTAADRDVKLYIDAEDNGSGINNMLVYDYYNPQYLGAFSSLKDWTFESSNGLKTVYLKVIDRAGNESETVSAHITLTDQKKEVKGVLKGEDLTWTKEMSPYLVTGNLLVEKDDTLTIEPGVDVQFSGDYYLQVEGKLSAIGTEGERISIYGIDGGANNWYGMKLLNDNDSILSYVEIFGLKKGIVGYCDIDHALIMANGWAIGLYASNSPEAYDDVLHGSIADSNVTGNVSVWEGSVKENSIKGDNVYFYSSQTFNNTISGSEFETSNSFVYNNTVSSTTVYSYEDIQKNNTYEGCTIYLSSELLNIQFNNCSFPRFAADVKDSNFINCGPISVESDRSTQEKYICTGNYWGDINTVEIKSKGEGKNLSFITDYYDDFNKSRIDYGKYKESAIKNAGYHEEEPDGTYSGYSIGDKGPAGGYVFYDKGFYSDGWRYLEAAPSDIGRYAFGYYRPDRNNCKIVGTLEGIGLGRYNTERLVEHMDINGKAYSSSFVETEEYAAKKCLDYSYGGYDDWFLPSKDELCEMYKALKCPGGTNHGSWCPDKTHAATSTEETRNSFDNNYYWTSSEYNEDYVYWQNFSDGLNHYGSYNRVDHFSVRPVRAF